jgi:hypothetical protein
MVSYERFRRVEARRRREMQPVFVSKRRLFTMLSKRELHFSKKPGSLQHRRPHERLQKEFTDAPCSLLVARELK